MPAPASPTTALGTPTVSPGSANSPANSPAFLNAAQTAYNDLNSGNYAGAWNAALGTSSMFGTNMGSTTTDPLLQALETSKGLQAFDPSKQWNQSSLDAYYAAFNGTGAYHGNNAGNQYLGKNPYGDWGAASAISSGSDQAANIAQEGMTPDVARFAGARPTKSFLSKYGTDIAALGLAIAAPYAIGALAPEVSAAAAIGTSGATGAATGAIGSIGAGALYGAGSGAALGALSGGNVGKDALLGAVGGGIGAGASTLGSYYGVPGAVSNLVGGEAKNLATGAIQGTPTAQGGNGSQAVNNGAAVAAENRGSTVLPPGMSNTGNIGNICSGGQGYNGNMASTDATLGSTLAGALPGVLNAGATTGAAFAGSNAIQNADKNAITTQQTNLGNIQGVWGAQQKLGQGADTSLGSALGTNGQPANYSGFENMPGYQFAVQQGTQAINRQAAAMGSAYTPNTSAAVGQYVTGTAMSDYNTYISQLMGAAGLGTTANQGLQTANQTTANNVSGLQMGIGEAQAGAYNTSGAAASGLFSPNGAGTSLVNYLGKGLGGTSGGNSGGNSGGVNNNGGGGLYQGGLGPTDTGVGNGSFGSGYDPSTGQPWISPTDPGAIPTMDPGNIQMTMPTIDPSIDTSGTGAFTDTGSGSYDPTAFLGGSDPTSIFSDRRLKTDIEKIGEASNGLSVYSFKYVWDKVKTHVGYMADEVQRLYPHAVGSRGGYMTVNYSKVP